ncbi:MAG: ZIP family metal transporter [Rhodopirellula sp.]|nr:ZIP family metal transporter [Rhodopirellula sp.]
MTPAVLLTIYCALIVLASLAGGWLPSLFRLSHLRMQLLMSLVGGMMIGVACLHLLPQAIWQLNDLAWLSGSLLIGVLCMLFLLRFGHVHHHGEAASSHADCGHIPRDLLSDSVPHTHDHDHDHSHDHHDHDHDLVSLSLVVDSPAKPTRHRLSWVGLFLGLALHTLFDGVALGASVVSEAGNSTATSLSLFGLGTFLAVALHKPLDAMSITSVMSAGGWAPRSLAVINGGFALACPTGALLFWFGTSTLDSSTRIVGCALAFSAGAFLCIALTDLIPEVLNHQHDRVKLSFVLLLGSVLAIGIELLPGHNHGRHRNLPQPVPAAITVPSIDSGSAFKD